MKNILSILFLLLAFTACGDKKAVTDVLNRSEAVMKEHPDSALNLLRTLTFDDFRKEKNRARYALLHSQALDKNYIDVTNDSLISVAVEYYKDKDDVRSKFLSCYYMGRVHANGERYLQATSCLMESEQLVEEVGDDYLSGLLYSEMGRIYDIYYDYSKSLEAHQKAAECYEREGMIGHRNYMWYYQSAVCRNMNDYDGCARLLQKTLTCAKEDDDEVLIKTCIGDLVMLYVELNRTAEAIVLYEQSTLMQGEFGTSSFMGVLSRLYASEGSFVKANNFLQKGWERSKNRNDSISLYLSSAMLSDKMGDGKKAYQELLTGISMQNVNVRQSLEQPILTVQKDYLSDKLEFEAYKLRMEKHLRILYIMVFSLLLIIVVWLFLRKLRKTKEEARITIDGLHAEMLRMEEESRQELDVLLKELEQKDRMADDTLGKLRSALKHQEENHCRYVRQMEEMEKQYLETLSQKTTYVSELFKAWFGVMDRWMMIYRTEETKGLAKLKRMGREISIFEEKYFVGNRAYCQLEKLLDVYHDNVMLHFRNEVKLADETDYRRVCYFFAGFSPDTIAWLMDEKTENVYQRRLRLRKNISSSAPLHKDLFLLMLGK
ncbi:MAG: hypothetical protein IKY99_06335 [Bacteroidaceae bacterium]|nr:hypothetical protein [Bacteroidaceae bacterium]MBR5613554.1 hypothetical protein [Bacteroidaceae bacterium]